MSSFDRFPEAISADVRAGWCELKEITKFDTACANKSSRQHLLNLYNLPYFTVEILSELSQKVNDILIWSNLRNIKISKLSMESKSLAKLFQININKSELKEIKFVHGNIVERGFYTEIINFINACPRLDSLVLDKVCEIDENFFNLIHNETWIRMKTLSLKSNWVNKNTRTYFPSLCKNLTNLTICDNFGKNIDENAIIKKR
jgi:hypothetical protein